MSEEKSIDPDLDPNFSNESIFFKNYVNCVLIMCSMLYEPYNSARKSVFGFSGQVWLNLDCSATEISKIIYISCVTITLSRLRKPWRIQTCFVQVSRHSIRMSKCWIQIRPNILLGLIWVQTVCKDYQQMTKVAASRQRVNSK